MENYLTQIANYLWTQSWQIAILAVTIAAVSLLLKNKSAHIRYLLWLILLAKCLVPPLLTIPLAILPQEQIAQPIIETVAQIPAVFVDTAKTTVYEHATLPSAPIESTIFDKFATITMSQWLCSVWILGMVIFVLIAGRKAIRLNRWLKRARKPLSTDLQRSIRGLFPELNEEKFPRIWLVDGIGQPFVWGLLRGSIYLPSDFTEIKVEEHRRGILSHELSHVIRFDAVVNLLQIIAQAVFWFHPLIWWANKKIRAEREKCCDEMAIAWLGTKARDFSTAIVNILTAEHKSTHPIPSLAVAGPVKNIEDRIKTIMNPSKKFYKRPSIVAAITILLLALIAVPTTLALTSKPAKKTDVQIDGSYRVRYFVKVVTDDENDRVTFEGQELDHNEFPENLEPLLGNVPNRAHTVLEIAFAPGTMPEKGSIAWLGIVQTLDRLEEKYGFEYLSIVGEHPLGSKGEPSETYFDGTVQFDQQIQIQLESAEDPPLVKCRSINFKGIDDTLTADISMEVISYPKTNWEFRIRLLDAESKEIKAVYQTFENSGIIAGVPKVSKQHLKFPVFKVNFAKAKNFELRIRQIAAKSASLREAQQRTEQLQQRTESMEKLKRLGLMFHMYTNDRDGKYPNSLDELKPYDKNGILSWALENVRYIGPDRSILVNPQALIAYDKTMLLEEGEVAVLFNDGHVKVRDKEEIKDIKFHGIDIISFEKRMNSAHKLSRLGRAMLIYANDHNDKYPDILEDLKEVDLTVNEIEWYKNNIEYFGDKVKLLSGPDTVLAYDKTLLIQEDSQGTDVLYNDSHVSFEKVETLEKLGITAEEKPAPQILTNIHILTVPADLPQLKEMISEDKSKPKMITAIEVDKFISIAGNNPKVRLLAAPSLVTVDGENGAISAKNTEGFESIKLNIKNTVWPDRKTTTLDLDFECTRNEAEDQTMTHVSSKATVLSEHAIAVAGNIADKDQILLLIVRPQILEAGQFSKTGVVAADELKSEDEASGKDVIEITARFLLLLVDANEITGFFEEKNLEDALVNINGDPNLKIDFLNDKQVEQLLKLSNTNSGFKLLTSPKILVINGEDATIRLQKTIKYTDNFANPNEPEVKELPIGTIFQVKPTLQEGGKEILLDFEFERTNLIDFVENGLPQTEMIHIKSRISVPDGGTLLIGGQKITDGHGGQKVSWCLIKATKLESDKPPLNN